MNVLKSGSITILDQNNPEVSIQNLNSEHLIIIYNADKSLLAVASHNYLSLTRMMISMLDIGTYNYFVIRGKMYQEVSSKEKEIEEYLDNFTSNGFEFIKRPIKCIDNIYSFIYNHNKKEMIEDKNGK